MKRYLAILALLPLLAMGGRQQGMGPGPGMPASAGGGGGPTLKGNTYCYSSGSVSAVSTSSCGGGGPLTVAVGDVVVVNCGNPGYTGATYANASDSAGNSYTQGPFETKYAYNAVYGNQLNWSVAATAGATNFTCTWSTSVSNAGMIVLDYGGLTGVENTSLFGNLYPDSSAFITGSFTTTARTLIIACTSSSTTTTGAWIAGSVAGGSGTIVGVPAASLTTSAYSACEAYQASTAVTGTAAMTATGASGDYAYGVLAFDY